MEVPQFFLGWRGHPAPRLRRRPRRGATRSRTPTRRTRPRWRRTSMPRREIMRREARERLFFVSSSESRTTIQVNCELDLKSTANLTSSQVATSLQVKLGLHFYRHSDFTSSERERPLWGCFWGAWRGTCLEVVIGESVHKDRPCGRADDESQGDLASVAAIPDTERKRPSVPADGFSLMEKWKSPLHPLSEGAWRFSYQKNWGTSNGNDGMPSSMREPAY